MSIIELKEEAIRQFAVKVEAADDEKILEMILEFLKGIDSNDKHGINLSRHYEAIKQQYGGVLKRLAQ